MLKRAFLSKKLLSFIVLATLFLILVNGEFVNVALANPSPVEFFPRKPVMTSPQIVVHSPVQNQNYNSSSVLLNFTVIKQSDWFTLPHSWGYDKNGRPLYVIFGNITSVYYTVNGGDPQNFSVFDTSVFVDAFPQRTFDFSANISLAKGEHSITVGIEVDSYYLLYDYYTSENATSGKWAGVEYPVGLSNVTIHGSSEPISFTILQEPFPIALVAGATGALAVIALSLGFIYKRKTSTRIIQ